MNLNLKSNGAIAKFLGFCTYQPTYHPASFCSLFWMLGFSPLIFVGCSIKAGVLGLYDRYHTAVDNSQKRKARVLVQIYLADPTEALQDFKENFVVCPGYIRTLRDWRVVDLAFRMLAEHFGDKGMRYFLVLARLGAIHDDDTKGWEFMKNYPYRIQRSQQATSVRLSAKQFIKAYDVALFVALVTSVCSIPVAFLVPEVAFTAGPTVLIVGLLITAFYRAELNVVFCNLYRGIKTKTCPIIKWEE